jgi:hypothetical protein
MTNTITEQPDGTHCIELDYSDEGIELTARTNIIGDAGKAAAYVPVFDADIRRVNSHLFPAPEVVETEYTEDL